MKKILALALLSVSVLAAPTMFYPLKVGWDPSPDASVASYNIYYGTDLTTLTPYVLLTNVVGRLTTNAVIYVPSNQNGFLVATAVAGAGAYNPTNFTFLESDFSNPLFLTATKGGNNFRVRP